MNELPPTQDANAIAREVRLLQHEVSQLKLDVQHLERLLMIERDTNERLSKIIRGEPRAEARTH